MIGINVDNLDVLINKNNLYLDSFKNTSKKLINSISDLDSCYSGNSLLYLFSEPINEIKNINTISKVIESYSSVLYSVKSSYKKQDETFKNQLSHMNSNL